MRCSLHCAPRGSAKAVALSSLPPPWLGHDYARSLGSRQQAGAAGTSSARSTRRRRRRRHRQRARKKNPIVFNEFLSNPKRLRIQWRWRCRCRCRGRCRCLCRCIAHCLQPIASYLAAAAGWPKVRCAVNHMDTIKWKGIGYGNQQHASIARARSLAV